MLGQSLSHYVIVEKIGHGGMGVVYRARDEQLERDVAIKVLPPGLLADEIARKRFRKEALALARLNHPNIETVFEFQAQEGMDFLVTEYIPGTTLQARIHSGVLPEEEILQFGEQLVRGMAAAHEEGVIHRDLKPTNLRLLPDGRLKIIDFGLARLEQREATTSESSTVSLSREVRGTLPYMAPEQLRGRTCDARTDIWSIGAILFEMATGRRVFPQSEKAAVMLAILQEPPTPPRQLNRNISPLLDQIILKTLEKDPEHRFQSAKQLQNALQNIVKKTSGRVGSSSSTVDGLTTTGLEIAHVLFMDIVSYSQLPIDEQQRTLGILQSAVRQCEEFRHADTLGQLICLPTGDGMALVFFGEPESPVRCACQLTIRLREHPQIKLRMGIHTGPVYRVEDINSGRNVAGGGINFAQRVMDCGDSGHILLSQSAAEVLSQLTNWSQTLHDLGNAVVKHGVHIHLYNFTRGEIGNPAVPSKIRSARFLRKKVTTLLLAGALAVLLLAAGLWIYRHSSRSYAITPISGRPSIAVLGFKNLGPKDKDWVRGWLLENFRTALGDDLNIATDETVRHLKSDLGITDETTLASDTLSVINNTDHADWVLSGSYVDHSNGQVWLNLNLQKTSGADAPIHWSAQTDLDSLVQKASSAVRELCGVRNQASKLNAPASSSPLARQMFGSAIVQLEGFNYLGAAHDLQESIKADSKDPLAHAELSFAWSKLGFDELAATEARTALGLASTLSDEQRLFIQGQYYEAQRDWQNAISTYLTAFERYPDNLEFGLHLARTQIAYSIPENARQTIRKMRSSLKAPHNLDPRLDLLEAQADEQLGDFNQEKALALASIEKGKKNNLAILVAEGQHQLGSALWRLGQTDQALDQLEKAKEAYRSVGDENEGEARELLYEGHIFRRSGKLLEAVASYKKAREFYEKSGNQKGLVETLNGLGLAKWEQGDLKSATDFYQSGLVIAKKIKDDHNEAKILGNLGNAANDAGDLSAAETYHREAVRKLTLIGDQGTLANERNSLANVLADEGDLSGAKQMYDDALKLAKDIGDRSREATVTSARGELLTDMGELAAAEADHKEALAIWTQIGSPVEGAYDRVCLGRLALEQGKYSEAESSLRSAIDTLDSQDSLDEEITGLTYLADVYLRENKLSDAKTVVLKSQALLGKSQKPKSKFAASLASAMLDAEGGKQKQALTAVQNVTSAAEAKGYAVVALESRLQAGRIQMQINRKLGESTVAKVRGDAASKHLGLIQRNASNTLTQDLLVRK